MRWCPRRWLFLHRRVGYQPAKAMPAPATVVLAIAPEGFRDEELERPLAALEQAGHRGLLASTRAGKARGMLGGKVEVHTTLAGLDARGLDAIVIVGGEGCPRHLWGHQPVENLVRSVYAAGKPVAAICFGSGVLARAGVLAGRRATGFNSPLLAVEMKRGGALFVMDPVVVDGSIVTANGPLASAAFADRLVTLVSR